MTVVTYDSDNKPLKQGTGFFIGTDGRFVTNCHVLEGASGAEIKTAEGSAYEIRQVVAEDRAADLVVASIQPLSDYDRELDRVFPSPSLVSRPMRISITDPRVGEHIVVIGNPLGLEQTVSEGIVSAIRSMAPYGKVLQITAPISPGSSGSPVINMQGEVIGVATSQIAAGQT